MAIYAVGDIQGCFDELQRLLNYIKFDFTHDSLWLCGDLISRGPASLQTLRFIKDLGTQAITVLGNHDLHLLAVAEGVRSTKDKGLQAILDAPDAPELLDWLRNQPLLHHDQQLGFTLVHAGIYPFWSLQQAQQYANEFHEVLHADGYQQFLHNMYGNKPHSWSEELQGWERLRFICNSFTRMRYCTEQGKLEFKHKDTPGTQPKGYLPWFEVAQRITLDSSLLFGHWSTLGEINNPDVYALDSGCVWGGKLTALRIDSQPACSMEIDCQEICHPGKDDD